MHLFIVQRLLHFFGLQNRFSANINSTEISHLFIVAISFRLCFAFTSSCLIRSLVCSPSFAFISSCVINSCFLLLPWHADGTCRSAIGLQLPGVINEMYSSDGPLGAVFSEDSISLNLWAPTAQNGVYLKLRINGDSLIY
ncbi:unnamed protein product [Amaranthus hypochondriacus]